MPRIRSLFRIAGLLPALLMPALPVAAAEERLLLGYTVYVGGLSVMEGALDLNLARDRYEVSLQAETKGFIGGLASWRTRSVSRGARSATVTPDAHDSANIWRGAPRHVSLRYDAARAVTATVAPDPVEDDREPVTAEQRRATLDPLSGMLAVIEGLRQGQGCGRTVPAFDGRRRFDMRFRDMGTAELPVSGRSAFAGSAQRCVVDYVAVAGYKRGNESNAFWRRTDGGRPPVEVWFAPVTAGGSPAPVRIETETPFGSVVAHLTRIGPPPEPVPAVGR